MRIEELNQRLKRYVSARAIKSKLGTFLRQNPHIVMNYQMDQLFGAESVGADGEPLGFYSYNTARFSKFPQEKKGGMAFTMYETGDFFNKMYIEIKGRQNISIEIGSRTAHLEEMLKNPAFETTEFFGLTEINYQRLTANLSTMLEEWIIEGITTGR